MVNKPNPDPSHPVRTAKSSPTQLRSVVREPNPAFIEPVRSDEYLPPVSLWTTLSVLFLVGAVGMSITLAAFLQYKVTVRAAANVRPTGDIRLVQAAIAGSVGRILVKENQVVKQGQAIATIEDSQLQTRKNQLAASVKNSQLQLKQIDAQISSLNKQHDFELSLMNYNIASAQAELQRHQREYQERQVTTRTQVREAQAEMDLARVEMEQYQRLAQTGAVAQLQIEEREQSYQAAQARLEGAKVALNPSAAMVAAANQRISQERARGKATLATLNKEREDLLQRRTTIESDRDRSLQDLGQTNKELKKTVLRSPDSGKILRLELRNPAQVVNAGQSIAQIAPGNATLVIKARVAAQDVSKIEICEQRVVTNCQVGKAQLRISAYPYPDYGVLKGAVRAISPDALGGAVPQAFAPQANSSNATAPYYEITIQPERPYIVKGDRSYPLKSGMEVTAEIISKEETLLKFLLRKARLMTDL